MSSLIVEVCRVEGVQPHPNADRLAIYTIKGWQVIDQIGRYQPGSLCVYFPPDTVLPPELSDRLGVTKYLKPLPKFGDMRLPGGRIRVAALRGQRSYGLAIPPDDPTWPEGLDVVAHYGVSKFDIPEPAGDGDAERPHPAFFRYTDIENIRNFPQVLVPGEEVVIAEKIHGKNTRLGRLRFENEDGTSEFRFTAGSHRVMRREFTKDGRKSEFWRAFTPGIEALLRELSGDIRQVILFGELFGPGVQDMTYGVTPGEKAFRCFDINVDGVYLDFAVKQELCARFEVPFVPILYRGPFDPAKVEELTDGPTTLCPIDAAGKFAGREGVVITPIVERTDTRLPGSGRVILKSISFDYLNRAEGTEYH